MRNILNLKEEKMKKIFIFFPIMIMVITACMNDRAKSLRTGKEYFRYIDEKKFDLAYNLISDEDKQSFDVAKFSQSMENFYKDMYYPPGMDNVSKIIIAKMPDSLIENFTKKGINCFQENKKVYILREVRKIPDIKTIKKSFDNKTHITGKMILNVLITGSYPLTPDSSRFAIIAIEKGRPRIIVGARHIRACESLLEEYESYLKKNLIISVLGKGYIYRTATDSVLGIIKYNLTNNSPDTLSALSVRGEFNGRPTNDTILYATSSKGIPPHQTITNRIVFSDPFLQIILGYYYNRINVKANISISQYPVGGDGPFFDSLMNSKPNAPIIEFTNPIKQGAGGL
jgi:hypothetical protein